MTRWQGWLTLIALLVPLTSRQGTEGPFALAQVLGYPYPTGLVTAPGGAAAAWVLSEHGVRNVWVAQAPDWTPKQLTDGKADDGQELTQLAFTRDGKTVLYVRGGDHDANWDAPPPDPDHRPAEPKVQIFAVALAGGAPKALTEGDQIAVSPRGDVVAFVKGGQIWSVPVDGSKAASQMIFARGDNGSPTWSPDGSRIAFVSDRGDHSFIAVYTSDADPLLYLAPSTSQDVEPVWSPDGRQIAYVRLPGSGGPPRSLLTRAPSPWAIWMADANTGAGHEVWHSPVTLHASFPGDAGLMWGDAGRLVFHAGTDGWSHLYSVPVTGGDPLLLTPGAFMVEDVALSPDRRTLVYSANTGADSDDVDRRHLFRVPVDRAAPAALTSGVGIEWSPVITGDGGWVTLISADAKRPPVPAAVRLDGGDVKLIGADRIPSDFPTQALVVPKKVMFRAPDGTAVHGQLFEQSGITGRHPGVIFVHGGPPRQMLLGWHYMGYYSNAYAVNQYLASRGYVVLSVNYRLGIGYGWDFHHPPHAGPAGASEYQDVLAGGKWLAARPEVDPAHVGIWGGSYGGYLTALALARNSDVFSVGVDYHGVHNWTSDDADRYTPRWRYERTDLDSARIVGWTSSPVADIATWRSPVLLIQGDDDRNVHFHETVDLARRLDAAGISYEELVIPDEIHGFLRWRSWYQADSAAAAYFQKHF
ncbi:MAG TPA: prolyl oligopeptidase family serine peptidase [Gemmatimonadales bacterium]|nr:prolyl oligopeptidase family serine peptidase [Gemmatimonadales bacterium]